MKYTIDKLVAKAQNKYILAQIISERAKQIKNDGQEQLGYKAINRAIEEFSEDNLSIQEPPKL